MLDMASQHLRTPTSTKRRPKALLDLLPDEALPRWEAFQGTRSPLGAGFGQRDPPPPLMTPSPVARSAGLARSISLPSLKGSSTNRRGGRSQTLHGSRIESPTGGVPASSESGRPQAGGAPSTPKDRRAPGAGRLRQSPNLVEWVVPRNAIASTCFAEEKAIHQLLVSPHFELLGEKCKLKFWTRGRRSQDYGDDDRKPGRCGWATLGFFPTKPGAHLHARLFVGPPERPWALSGDRLIYSDGHFLHPDQLLECEGLRPFAWDDLPEEGLVVGVEVLANRRIPFHEHTHRDLRGV